jgi:Tfp pilus assembly protein PilO
MVLAVLGGLVLLYGWNSFFLGPRNRAAADVRKNLTAARQQEQDLRQNLTQLKRLAADTRSREAELARLGRLVPADADVAGAIVALDDTAKAAQVAWSSFVPQPPAAAVGGPAPVGLSIKVGGTFSQIFDYLHRLETLDRLVVVDSVQLTASNGTNGQGGSPKVEAELKARMFTAAAMTPAAATPAVASQTAALPKAGG